MNIRVDHVIARGLVRSASFTEDTESSHAFNYKRKIGAGYCACNAMLTGVQAARKRHELSPDKGQLKCDGTRAETKILSFARNGRVHLTFWRRNYFFLNFSTSCI